MNFKNSDCVKARVDYESFDSVVCGKHAVSNFGGSFGRIKSLSVYRSTSMLTGKFFCTNILYSHKTLLLYRSKEESPRSARLRGIQYRVSIVLA